MDSLPNPAFRLLAFSFVSILLAGCGEPAPEPAAPAVESPPTEAAEPPAARTAPDPGSTGDYVLSNFKWDGPMRAGESVTVRNPYGGIRCRRTGTDELVVSAQIQSFTDGPAPVIDVVEAQGGYVVRIDHEHSGRAEFGGDYDSGFAGRVDVTVLLPSRTRAVLSTENDTLRVKGFNGSVSATTRGGDISYRAKGDFELTTDSGNVEAFIDDYRPKKSGEINTGTGNVVVVLDPEDATVSVRAESSGKLVFERGEDVRAGQNRGKERLTVRMGGGERELKVSSESGNITIKAE